MKFNYAVVIHKNIQDVSAAFEDSKAMKAFRRALLKLLL